MKHWLRHPTLTLAASAALVLASGSAAALGLGQIEVRSRAGQPLVAEIPIVSTTPGELDALQARLASPETFARVGLKPPQGAMMDLRFEVVNDRSGRPVIRVTSERPIEQPLLTFLVEVDWGQGRLVREYSALIDTPTAVAAPVQPPIQAPAAAPSNTIQRPVAAPQQPLVPAPQRPASVARRPEPAAASAPGEYGPVRRGETLSSITSRLGLDDAASLNQAMIAILRANPDAFIEGDINRLRQGAVLRVPAAAEVAAVDAAQASQIVRDRMRQWREARRQAVLGPDAAQAAATSAAQRPAVASSSTRTPKSTAAPPTGADARLEIVPPAASRAAQAGTQSGLQAGGEGSMLQQELQQTRETLVARDAELQELKSRVAELEKLQSDQQRLIALKDAELAAAQKRLAAPAATAEPPALSAENGSGVLPWIFGAAALLALAFAAWWARRRPAATPFRAPPASAASELAAAFPARRRDEDLLVVATQAAEDGAAAPVASSRAEHAPDDRASSSSTSDATNAAAARPAHAIRIVEDAAGSQPSAPGRADGPRTAAASGAGAAGVEDPEDWSGPDLAREDAPREDDSADLPTWHSPRVTPLAPVEPTAAPMPLVEPAEPRLASPVDAAADAPVNERIELAQAYLDLGDHDSARQLLGEVVVTGDRASRQRALRLLREMQ